MSTQDKPEPSWHDAFIPTNRGTVISQGEIVYQFFVLNASPNHHLLLQPTDPELRAFFEFLTSCSDRKKDHDGEPIYKEEPAYQYLANLEAKEPGSRLRVLTKAHEMIENIQKQLMPSDEEFNHRIAEHRRAHEQRATENRALLDHVDSLLAKYGRNRGNEPENNR